MVTALVVKRRRDVATLVKHLLDVEKRWHSELLGVELEGEKGVVVRLDETLPTDVSERISKRVRRVCPDWDIEVVRGR